MERAVNRLFCLLLGGILLAILAGTPVGSTIVAVDILVFLVFCVLGRLLGGGRA